MNHFLKQTQWIIFAYVLSCICWGCSLKYQRRKQESLSSFQNTLTQLREKRDAFQDIRGRAAITLIHEGKKQTFFANIILDPYSRFRLEGLGFLNTPYFFLIADGKWIWFYVPDEQKIVRGGYSEDTLFRLTGIKSSVEELIALFSGNLPPSLTFSEPEIISSNPYQLVVELQSTQKKVYRLWIDRRQEVLFKMEISEAHQNPFLTASFDNYENINDYNWPGRIECNFLSSRIQVRIRYKKIFLNLGVTEKDFLLRHPPAAIIENLE